MKPVETLVLLTISFRARRLIDRIDALIARLEGLQGTQTSQQFALSVQATVNEISRQCAILQKEAQMIHKEANCPANPQLREIA